MSIRILLAALVTIAIPIAVIGQPAPPKARDTSQRRVCEVDTQIGTRLGNIRRCRTKAERDAARAESREIAERIQMRKAYNGEPPH